MQDIARNAERRLRLQARVGRLRAGAAIAADVVVTHNEVNDRHGTGVLVQRLVERSPDLLSIRAYDHYGGEHVLEPGVVMPALSDRAEIYRWTLETTSGREARRVLCVPFTEPELLAALSLHDAQGADLCLYVMDDSNVRAKRISDALMAEAIEKAKLRLAISSDMRDVYEAKFARRFWILPPTLPAGILPGRSSGARDGRAVILGNIWGRSWLRALSETVRGSGLSVDWYASAPHSPFLDAVAEELAEDGIHIRDHPPVAELAERVREYEVSLVPSMPTGGEPENEAVAALSLPTRIPFLVAASEIPIVVLGAPDASAARFVTHFGLGAGCRYERGELRATVERFRGATARAELRDAVARMRVMLRCDSPARWLSGAIEGGAPPSQQFEALQVQPPLSLRSYIEEGSPLGPWMDGFEATHAALRRLAAQGHRPRFILDAGASTGIWSTVAARTFPDARYVLIEPLKGCYDDADLRFHREQLRESSLVEAAVGSCEGTTTLHFDRSLYQASRYPSALEGEDLQSVTVLMTTLDTIASDAGLDGPGLLKLDLQGGELEALDGASRLLQELVDVVVVEVTLDPISDEVPSWGQIDERLRAAGFGPSDEAGSWRDPDTGRLLQLDLVYARRGTPR